jgi:uncharacterized protein (TIGR00266 family)
MLVELSGGPAYTIAYCKLGAGESVFSERGAMVTMSPGIEVGAAMDGGLMRAALRKVMTDESFLFARYKAQVHGAWVAFAPRFPGDVKPVRVDPGADLLVQSGSLLAYESTVDASARLGSFSSVVLREGATVLRLSGEGVAVICAYGSLQEFNLLPGQKMVVDTGHLAAWSASLGMRVGPLSGVVTSATTGEGMVGEMTGPGTVWVQTRAETQLRSWLFPERGQN